MREATTMTGTVNERNEKPYVIKARFLFCHSVCSLSIWVRVCTRVSILEPPIDFYEIGYESISFETTPTSYLLNF
jgi:hypothetical protein